MYTTVTKMHPAGINFHVNFLNAVLEEEGRRQIIDEMRRLRDNSNPFLLPDDIFIKLYRMRKHIILNILIPDIRPHLNPGLRINKIPIHLKVLAALYFLGHGGYQKTVGKGNHIAMSQSAISKAISEIFYIMGNILLPRYVKFPTSIDNINTTKRGFMEKFQFPGVIGTLDCTHVSIIAPKENAIAYYNRKGYYSINVQMICDANLIVLAVNARFPGSTHDSAIWRSSSVNNHLRRKFEQGDYSSWLLGDSGYALLPWVMTPILDAPEESPEGRYTKRHCQARNTIERCFGVLKGRFRCLLKHRVLNYNHEKAALIIYSAVILHNICRTMGDNYEDLVEDDNLNENFNEDRREDENLNILGMARNIRARLIRTMNM